MPAYRWVSDMEVNAALANPIITLTAQAAPSTVPSNAMVNPNAKGVTLTFSTTALTGAPTIQIALFAVDLVTRNTVQVAASTAVAAVAGQALLASFFPGGTSPVVNAVVPLAFVVKVIVSGTGTVTGTLAGNLQS